MKKRSDKEITDCISYGSNDDDCIATGNTGHGFDTGKTVYSHYKRPSKAGEITIKPVKKGDDFILAGIKAMITMFLIYYCVSMFAHSWRNPEMTEMQIFRDFVAAMRWGK